MEKHKLSHRGNLSNFRKRHCRTLNCAKIVHIRSYSGPYFPAFGLITEILREDSEIQSESGKIRTRTTPNTDTFCAVKALFKKSHHAESRWYIFHFYCNIVFITERCHLHLRKKWALGNDFIIIIFKTSG